MTHSAYRKADRASPITQQLSPRLTAATAALIGIGIISGLITYLNRSPTHHTHTPGTSAWTPHLIIAAATCALYALARWRHDRRPGRGSGTLLLLAPLSRSAAERLTATLHHPWRLLAALPPLAIITFGYWRTGQQITAGLDPNFTTNAWGGPTYLGAMACHYLDGWLIIAAFAWLLNWIMPPTNTNPSTNNTH